MLLYYLFWMLMGFILHFYIIFGTNLLTGGLAQIAVFLPILVFRRKGISNGVQNRMKPSGELFLEQTWSRGLGVDVKKEARRPRGSEACLPPWARPPSSWAPRSCTDLLLPPIYTHIPRNQPGAPRNPISTAATFCTREISSWGLFDAPPEGESITEGFYINTIASPMMCE